MKTKLHLAALALALATLNPQLSTAHAQGALTPPGAPAPTMKSLDQIEARTPISSVPFTITQSGSYYLTTNVTTAVSNAIVITVSGVTLDLNGFTIASTMANAANGGTAILLTSKLSDITIFNGHIRSGVTNNGSNIYLGAGFAGGINSVGTAPQNIRVSGVSVTGCLSDGINLTAGNSTLVEACTVRTIGGKGIEAEVVKNCVAMDCGNNSYAIHAVLATDCRGEGKGTSLGVYAAIAQNCIGVSDTGTGVYAAESAANCYGACPSGTGLYANTKATGCTGTSTIGTGLSAFIANNCRGTSTSGTPLTTSHNVNSF
jgi:hypothetical protein